MRRTCSLLVALFLFGFLSDFGPFDKPGPGGDATVAGAPPQSSMHGVDSHNK